MRWSAVRRALGTAATAAALLAAALTPAATAVAQAGQVPSVGVAPVGGDPRDPNAGQWFVTTASPGQKVRLSARISNPATVTQTATLYFADLKFSPEGTPLVADRSVDVGTWGSFDSPTVSVPAGASVIAGFSITVPDGAEPGDHVGVVVAESQPQGEGVVRVVKRVATRLYVTVPGDARQEFAIERVRLEKDSSFFAREMSVTVVLRNTGRLRLQPSVSVDGATAKGAELLMTKSVESYVATRPVRFWGGPLRFRIDAQSQSFGRAGPTRVMYASAFVIPWQLLSLLAGVLVLGAAARFLLRRRGSRYSAMQSDLRRIERMLTEMRSGASTPGTAVHDDPELAIRAALKQARRAGDRQTEEKLLAELERAAAAEVDAAAAEAEVSPDEGLDAALTAILRDMADAPPDRIAMLLKAARAFGTAAIRRHGPLVDALPEEVRAALIRASERSTARKPRESKRRP